MSPQINSQGPLSDLPRLHVADESNMAAEMSELEICRYPGNARSKVWEYFGFYQLKEGPKTKENLDMTKECFLVDFSDYNRWLIGRGNPIISNDRLWNLNRFPPLVPVNGG